MQTNKLKFKLIQSKDIEISKGFNFSKVFNLLEMKDTPKRRESYYLSRYALMHSLKDFNYSLNMDSLILLENSHVLGVEKLTCSIAHTKDAAIAVTARKDEFLAVGIDLESENRTIKEGATRYFINPEDQMDSFCDLEKWVIKEACYKAFSNLLKEEFLLKDVICSATKTYYNSFSGEFSLFRENGFIIAIAHVPNI